MSRAVSLAGVVAGALVVASLTAGPVGARAAASGPVSRSARADQRLTREATGPLLRHADGHGSLDFLGTDTGAEVADPAVRPTTGVAQAARAHLDRYGAAFGLDRPGASLARQRVTHTVAGTDVVSYQQRLGGLPVIGGDVVVTLRPDRQLSGLLSTASRAPAPRLAQVPATHAATIARTEAHRVLGGRAFSLVDDGRWVYDPALFPGTPVGLGARSVWRFEVTDHADVRRVVLVDDQTGSVVLDLDQIDSLDRVVCDDNDVKLASVTLCTSNFVRTEGGPASTIADANNAYDYAGATSTFYAQIANLDLTDLIGLSVGGVKHLASTVRFCYTDKTCPYKNAFWNGSQMTYGDGFASADDVVAHEMTHGVTSRYSNLFYWGQSGAMNESMSDVMGEIVDHRNPSPGDSPTNWALGEDLPGTPNGIRNMQDPTLFKQPDSMTSSLWKVDTPSYGDDGGVHTNSGVGNKTGYLISQGGTFNGQTITGIDGTDPTLTKTAQLYLLLDQSLTSGSDYADEARVLDQSCRDLVSAHKPGFVATDCDNVHKATLATQLTTTPTNAPQAPDAPPSCPTGTQRQILVFSETGTPTSTFTGTGHWARSTSNATYGPDAWGNGRSTTKTARTETLTQAAAVTLPTGQPSYLWFQGWNNLSYTGTTYNDGGTVEIGADGATPVDASTLPWVNGPTRVLTTATGNPAGGRSAFAGDSFGWTASQADLSSYAGKSIKVQFSLNFGNDDPLRGWYLDNIAIYTCNPKILNQFLPVVHGAAQVGRTLTSSPGKWTPGGLSFAYQWLRNGVAIPGATHSTYRVVSADVGKRLSLRVTASRTGYASAAATSSATGTVVHG